MLVALGSGKKYWKCFFPVAGAYLFRLMSSSNAVAAYLRDAVCSTPKEHDVNDWDSWANLNS